MLFTVDYLKCVLLNCWNQVSQDTVSAATDQLSNFRHAECCLNWKVYNINVNCEFKMICMQKNERHL